MFDKKKAHPAGPGFSMDDIIKDVDILEWRSD